MGLLTSDRIPADRLVFYGMIADGIHTNPAALRIAHRAHPAGQDWNYQELPNDHPGINYLVMVLTAVHG